MKHFSCAVALLLPLLAACSAGGGSTTAAMPQNMTGQLSSLSRTQARSEAQSDAMRAPQPLYTPSTADLLYVGNVKSNSIAVYRYDVSGNTAPLKVISGSKTGISNPGQLSEDAQGNLYVANGDFALPKSASPAILVFAHGANGNVAPIRKLAGPLTGIHSVEAMTVDQATGKIFVVDAAPGNCGLGGCISFLRFAPNATGNTAPFARASAAFPAFQLASDSTGNNLIEAHSTNSPSDVGYGVETLPKQFQNGVAMSPVYDTAWFEAAGVADDPTTKTYLATAASSGGIFRLAENTVGNGPDSPGQTFAPPPISIITSDKCGSQIALGYLRNIYVTHSTATTAFRPCPTDAVYVYPHDSSGNVPALRVLSGPASKLDEPFGIYEGQ